MLATVATLFFLSASAAAQTSTTVCVAGQCLQGSSNLSIGAIVTPSSGSTLLLLPGDYTTASEPQSLLSALTGSSRLSFTTGFAPDNAPTSASLPLQVALQPGVLTSAATFYRGQTSFAPLPNSPPSANATTATSLLAGSLLISDNVWIAVSSGGNQRVIMWDPVADMTQLPQGLGQSQLSLLEVQSSACNPGCSGGAVCSSAGTCVCPAGGGFAGSSCETCAAGHFGPNCQPCPDNCAKCDEGSTGTGKCLVPAVANAPATCNCLNGVCNASNQCTCNAGWTSASNGTACAACSNGFFLTSSNDCQACQLDCQQCSPGTGQCTQCAAGFTVNANDNTKCVPVQAAKQCPDGSFANGDTCSLCSPLCKTCNGAGSNNCIVCGSGTYQLNGACVPTDASGVCSGSALIANNNKNLCDSCPSKCTACGIPNFNVASTIDQAQCTKCLPGFVLSNGDCIEQCPAGTFISPNDNFTCLPCDSTCSTCAGDAKFCLSCSGNSLALNGACVTACPATSFSSSGACLPCHSDCGTCSGPGFNQCTSCSASRPVLQGAQSGGTGANVGRCMPTCTQSQFFDPSSSSCHFCDASCSSCSGAGPNACLACSSSSQVLKGGACVAATCTDGTSVVPGLGACLSELVNAPPNKAATPIGVPNPGSTVIVTRRPLEWWQILLMALGCAFLALAVLMCWRRRMRKKRAAQTARFAAQIKRRGVLSRGLHWVAGKLRGKDHNDRAVEELLVRLRAAEEARGKADRDLLSKSLGRYDDDARSWRSVSRGHSPQPSILPETRYDLHFHAVPDANRTSTPSIYSVVTGERPLAPDPRQPLRRDEAVPGSRFSSSTLGSYAKRKQPNYGIEMQATGSSSSSESSESKNPFRR